jgi:hypothetical protein
MERTLVMSLTRYATVCAIARIDLNGILIELFPGTAVKERGE